MKILCVIPARGGSKGVPRKNDMLLCGKHILAYTIEHCRAVPGVSIVVTTDDDQISRVAESFNIPALRRGQSLSDDDALSTLAVWDAARRIRYSGIEFDYVAEMAPCVPIRPANCLAKCVEALLSRRSDSAIALEECGNIKPNLCVTLGEEGQLAHPWGYFTDHRRNEPPAYFISGACYIATAKAMLDADPNGTDPYRFFGARRAGVVFPRGTTVDISDPCDVERAEFYLSRKQRGGKCELRN